MKIGKNDSGPSPRTTLPTDDTSNFPEPTPPVLDENGTTRRNVPDELNADMLQSIPSPSRSHSLKLNRNHTEKKNSWRKKISWRSFWLASDDLEKEIGEHGDDVLGQRAKPGVLARTNTPVAVLLRSVEDKLLKMAVNIEQQEAKAGDNGLRPQIAAWSEGSGNTSNPASLNGHLRVGDEGASTSVSSRSTRELDNQSGKRVRWRSFWLTSNHAEKQKNIGDDAAIRPSLETFPSEDRNTGSNLTSRLPAEDQLLKVVVDSENEKRERKRDISPDTSRCIPSRPTSDPGRGHRENVSDSCGRRIIAWPFFWSGGNRPRKRFRQRFFRLSDDYSAKKILDKGQDASVPRAAPSSRPSSEDLSDTGKSVSQLPQADELKNVEVAIEQYIAQQKADTSNANPASKSASEPGKVRWEDGGYDDDRTGKNEEWQSTMEMQLMGMPQRFSYDQLSVSTGGFSNDSKLGHGGFGSVYRGTLPWYNIPVAVKKINGASAQGEKEFMAEVSIISQLRHRNLIQLLGWCKDEEKFLLVYELMPNGSLDKALALGGRTGKETFCLTWPQRFKIATGTAAALEYLHQGLKQQVIHRDVKTSNIMLDEDWNAKLGDFGLARLVDRRHKAAATVVAGTPGYIAPEVFTSGRFTDQTDVFAFGVVILELACGRQAWSSRAPPQETVLVNWVWESLDADDVLSTVDERLEDYDKHWMKVLLMVGLLCTHPTPLARPSMRRVVQMLAGDVPVPAIPPWKPDPVLLPTAESILIDDLEGPLSESTCTSKSELLDLEITFAQMTGRQSLLSLS